MCVYCENRKKKLDMFGRPKPQISKGQAYFVFSKSLRFIKTIVINVIITLYLCIQFENKAIFVMSFSRSVENLRCIYIYYIDGFSDLQIALLFWDQRVRTPIWLKSLSKRKALICTSCLPQEMYHFVHTWPPPKLDFFCVSDKGQLKMYIVLG